MRYTLACLSLGMLMLCLAGPAKAYPKPNAYPLSWELKIEYHTPRRILIKQAGSQKEQAYWYMTYTVTNLGKESVNYLPVFQMMTEDGVVARSDRDIPQVVYNEIRGRERNKHLETVTQIAGTIRAGEDQARDGMAVWPEPEDFGGKFQIFVSGLSGEGQILKDEKGNRVERTDKDGNKEPVVLWKTLRLEYQILGEDRRPGHENVQLVAEEWIMR